MSKTDIEELLSFYRKEFKLKTGMELTVAPIPIKKLSIKEIVDGAESFFRVDKKYIYYKGKDRERVKIRQMIYAACRENSHSYERIAISFKMDHTSIIHNVRTFYAHNKYELEYKEEFERFEAFLHERIHENLLQEVA